ncbi:coiled-coil domain-containing protein 117 isoform X2 [Arvicanthis niloticus]|uniref:coiled-coil domain-containing protein 117 isoform X2 n=1 Tax=Arvicanthis niloticus TaxID=61156 RepID=UPI00148729B0|nr:coiled-coil domain-containing protein 117 [Arvicanthis niloticus]
MAALGRPFSGLPLSGSADFLQPPPAFAGRAFPPGAAGHDLAPRPGVRAPSSPVGRAARGRVSIHCRKKQKRLAEDDECPVRKKRLIEAELGAVGDEWVLGTQQGHGVNTCPSDLSVPSMLDAVCEEMDQTTGEPQFEVARRRLQEIEDRIIDEDEEVESDRNVSHLPSLILSDTMKTGLKREFDEVFTKMIESMSRPSMELVLWKPLPELLCEKPKPSSNPKNYMGGSQTKHAATGTAFPQRTELLLEPQCTDTPPLYHSLETAASTEEEMEL